MDYENIMVNVSDAIAVITFNRPKALNALNDALLKEFSKALDGIAANPDVRVLVLTGAGEKAFVAGADITELAKLSPLQSKLLSERGHAILFKLENLPQPVIAAVNGFALGGGSEIALACDFIYASEKAQFGLPEINLGIIPGYGGTQRLARLVGKNMAKEMILTGKMISAAEAKEIGMVNRVCAPEALMAEVMKTAQTIAAKGVVSVRAAKQAINNGFDADLQTGCRIEMNHFALATVSSDAKEGFGAFLEKRKAAFNGKLDD
ncbi:MAG: enoyl-CoA hydratase-related protein [Desulfobacterales bacterium]|jgi:enoyl-CoA hydratase|nr:enoyl-CoA hydratase-related protein [Desulfobacterales bacterium]